MTTDKSDLTDTNSNNNKYHSFTRVSRTGSEENDKKESRRRPDRKEEKRGGRRENEREREQKRRGRDERGRPTERNGKRERERRPPPGNWLEVNKRGRDNYRCIVGFVGAAI